MSLEKPTKKEANIFDADYNWNDPSNQNHEVNLRDLATLKAAKTPDQIRKVFKDLSITTPMPSYDEGIISHRDALIKKLEDYLKRVGAIPQD